MIIELKTRIQQVIPLKGGWAVGLNAHNGKSIYGIIDVFGEVVYYNGYLTVPPYYSQEPECVVAKDENDNKIGYLDNYGFLTKEPVKSSCYPNEKLRTETIEKKSIFNEMFGINENHFGIVVNREGGNFVILNVPNIFNIDYSVKTVFSVDESLVAIYQTGIKQFVLLDNPLK